MKGPPQYQTPAPDPLYAQVRERAQQDEATAGQAQARGDTASLMARYGALAGATSSVPALSLAAPSTQNPSTLPIGMAMNLMAGGQDASPLAQIARQVSAKLAA